MAEDTKDEERRTAQSVLGALREGGGRFFRMRSRARGDYAEVDDDVALEKIKSDVRRRRENAKHW
eukprot:CAMPEP_0181131554 /NCGR_PEP_ID=MMETSP1071-20121207/30487_1 /TAXON_ID=35127 /ORGANISM="Thalassiosira sp., Strain NH16" /LENGTH=64 /DNA_ID=CAMNT_0023217755 /DNA_START=105 /DNA_END=296 /DNA_ORIENTATION=-